VRLYTFACSSVSIVVLIHMKAYIIVLYCKWWRTSAFIIRSHKNVGSVSTAGSGGEVVFGWGGGIA